MSGINDEILVSLVHKSRLLWDKKNTDYKNTDKKKEVWEKIGSYFNTTGSNVNRHFKAVREKYVREKAKMKDAGYYKRQWHLIDKLRFLDDVIVPRRSFSCRLPENELLISNVSTSVSSNISLDEIHEISSDVNESPSNADSYISWHLKEDISSCHSVNEQTDNWVKNEDQMTISEEPLTSSSYTVSQTEPLYISTPSPVPDVNADPTLTSSENYRKKRTKREIDETITETGSQVDNLSSEIWNIKPRIKLFCKYLGARMDILSEEQALDVEDRIMCILRDCGRDKVRLS